MDNVLIDADVAQATNVGHVEAAGGYAGPPRFTRTDASGDAADGFLSGLITFGGMGRSVPVLVLLHAVLLAWLPALAPATALAGVCLVISIALRGHSPDDTRYFGLRAALQATAFVVLAVRFGSELVFGFEANAWWLIYKLPDTARLWGDLDPVLRVLLADPVGLYMALALGYDLWLPHRTRSVMMGGGFWTRYLAPPPVRHEPTAGGSGLSYLPLLLLAPPLTTPDAVYALALGLGVSFIAAYVLSVEVSDILCVRRQRPLRRAGWYARYSDRRYQPLTAIGDGLPRLLIPFGCGGVALLTVGPGLVTLGAVVCGCFAVHAGQLALSWEAVAIFASYPGDRHPRAGVHDLTPIVRDPALRASLLRFAALAWVPFLRSCVSELLPGLPSFDGWGVVWPDLHIKTALVGVAVLVFVPSQLVCGVLRTSFGHILGRFEERGSSR